MVPEVLGTDSSGDSRSRGVVESWSSEVAAREESSSPSIEQASLRMKTLGLRSASFGRTRSREGRGGALWRLPIPSCTL